MTPRNFQNKLKGFNKMKSNEMYFQRHLAWGQMRSMGAKLTAREVYPLDIDESLGGGEDIPSREESNAVIERFKKINPKLFRPKNGK